MYMHVCTCTCNSKACIYGKGRKIIEINKIVKKYTYTTIVQMALDLHVAYAKITFYNGILLRNGNYD